MSMCRFCRLGFRPAPSAGAGCVANGLETATSMKEKKTATPPSTGTTQATRSGAVRRLIRTTAAEYAVRISSQSSSDPSCPPQNADSVYSVGSRRALCSATYAKLKSCRTKALKRTTAATAAAAKAAMSALRADSERRRRPLNAAKAPAAHA